MKISDANNIYVGSSQASAVYLGTNKIWPVSSITPGMRMLDGPTFRSYNNITAGAAWSTSLKGEWRGDVYAQNLELSDYDIWTPSGTYLELGQDDYFTLKQYSKLYFNDYNYTKIIFKDIIGSTNPTAGTGYVVYNAGADELVWTGNATNFYFVNGNSQDWKFKYIYYDVAAPLCTVNCLALRRLNNLAVEDMLTNQSYDLSTDSKFQMTLNGPSSGAGKVIYADAFRIYAPSSGGYMEISSTAGNMTSISITGMTGSASNLDVPSNISADSGSISVASNNRDLTWTGNSSTVRFSWTLTSLTITKLTIDYTEL